MGNASGTWWVGFGGKRDVDDKGVSEEVASNNLVVYIIEFNI